MGCILSTRSEPKQHRVPRGNIIKVKPIGDGTKMVISRTDFTIFQVQNHKPNIKQVEEKEPKSNVEEETSKALEGGCEKDGLVLKLTGIATKGVSFEISQEGKTVAVPPKRLMEIKVKEPSEDEIRDKLLKAERRRKQLEEERILKVRKMTKTESPEIIQAYIKERKALEEIQTKKMDDAVSSRQQRLRNIRDRLRERDQHAKAVRLRKLVNLDDMGEAPKDERNYHFHTRPN